MSDPTSCYSLEPAVPQDVDCICLGTGRFLRSVLIPPLLHVNLKPILIQTRGRTFLDYMIKRTTQDNEGNTPSSSYQVDTVLPNGTIQTDEIPCHGAFTLGSTSGKQTALQFISQMKRISMIGTGMTEAGLESSETSGMKALYDILQVCYKAIRVTQTMTCINPHGKICIVNTDNVPQNGTVIQTHMLALAKAAGDTDTNTTDHFYNFLQDHVVFLNSMVDRITSQRSPDESQVPKCEPIPSKALVLLDSNSDLPKMFHDEDASAALKAKYGVVVRSTPQQLQSDIALKLRIANGTHTAIAHTMALCSFTMTDTLSKTTTPSSSAVLFMDYLESLVQHQIVKAAASSSQCGSQDEAQATWMDWKSRLCHPNFGLSTFFITQNGPAKGGIRLGPTVQDLLQLVSGNNTNASSSNSNTGISVAMAFAFAALLRWLTPVNEGTTTMPPSKNGIYRGWLDGFTPSNVIGNQGDDTDTHEYADGLRYNLTQGWYEFRCACFVGATTTITTPMTDQLSQNLAQALGNVVFSTPFAKQPTVYIPIIRQYLLQTDGGGNLSILSSSCEMKNKFETFVSAVATLYARMIVGDGLQSLLQELKARKHGLGQDCNTLVDNGNSSSSFLPYRVNPIPSTSQLMNTPVTKDTVEAIVCSEVSSAEAIDVHTHLLPPSHGGILCLWGIDELLTYHYLVAEYFITAPSSVIPEEFYAKSKQEQANLIWQALFIERSPISEACRGVITTLQALGLTQQIQNRDLQGIRDYYNSFRDKGLAGTEEFSEMVYNKAGVKYAIMTNIPFDANEAQHWRPKRKEYPHRYRSALRVDPLLAGDQKTVKTSLKASGYDTTLDGARQYLRDWCDTMKPEYMMASTPHNFVLKEGSLSNVVRKTGVNEDVMKEPFAFVTGGGTSLGAAGATTSGGVGADCTVTCDGEEDATASIINEDSDFLSEVLMKVCEERDLPVALKIGAHRGVNPKLLSAGDGVVVADTSVLARLCTRFPKVRFLATFLSRNNQHEACVLASKFRNLHIYGCWWFCNNPSMIKEITTMRIEMLGTAFTAQHSDARVLDQLIYKWSHSRAVIASVLVDEYTKLCNSGWSPARKEIRRDIERLFGGSYEDFMTKSFA